MTERAIKVNPEKVRAIVDMSSHKSVWELQRLVGKITAMSSFISRSVHRSYPFFQILNKAQKFGWDDRCDKNFRN